MKKNKLWIPITAIVLVLALAAGMFLLPKLSRKEAAVFPVTMVGYTDFYSGSTESYGMVTTDKVQTLYLSDTQTITEILVYPGQEVKKGDVLFTYDTTLSDLAVERKDLANQQLEVQLKTAQAELKALNKMKPIVYKPSTGTSTAKTDYVKSPSDKSLLNRVYSTKTTGKSSTSPLYFWLKIGTEIDDELIGQIFSHAEAQAKAELKTVYVVFQMSPGNTTNADFSSHNGIKFTKTYEIPSTIPTEPTVPTESTEPTEDPEDPENPENPTSVAGSSSQGSKMFSGYTMSFFTPPSAPKEDSGTVQWNDGYTSAELTAMKNEKNAEIKQLQFDIKMGKAELKIMQKEASDGKVTADFDGVVVHVLEPAEALETGEPLMKVSGGGGYYVQGAVSELALDTIRMGQDVTVNSWDTGAVYTGKVVEIGTYPTQEEEYSYGNSDATYYPYKVFIDESADLQEGYYVSLLCQTEEQAAGTLYVQNAFLRSEGNRIYVFVRNAEGLLEKRYLECGVSTDGYMTPIYSGITEEDFLAFPYGKTIKEGAPTYEGTDQDLYGY